MKSNFLQRAITGIIFVAVLIGCIVGGAVSFGILFAIISALAINEFCNLVNHVEGIQVNKRICILSGIFLFLCFFYFGIDPSQTGIFIPYLALFIYQMDNDDINKEEFAVEEHQIEREEKRLDQKAHKLEKDKDNR